MSFPLEFTKANFFEEGSCRLNVVGKHTLACIRERVEFGPREFEDLIQDSKDLLNMFDALMQIAEEQRKSLALVAERSELKGGT